MASINETKSERLVCVRCDKTHECKFTCYGCLWQYLESDGFCVYMCPGCFKKKISDDMISKGCPTCQKKHIHHYQQCGDGECKWVHEYLSKIAYILYENNQSLPDRHNMSYIEGRCLSCHRKKIRDEIQDNEDWYAS